MRHKRRIKTRRCQQIFVNAKLWSDKNVNKWWKQIKDASYEPHSN